MQRATKSIILGLSYLFSALLQAQITQSVTKAQLPLWEAGAAFVSALVPAYPASSETNLFSLPVPTFFYRGEILRADEEGGMRGRFFHSENLEINLSIGGSLPASSKDIPIRKGMPNLQTMVEAGPGLLSTLWRYRGNFNAKLGLNIPIRSVWTIDFFEAKERGLVLNPLLYFITEGLFIDGLLTFTSLSSIFATQKLHKVFYQVDQQFVTNSRSRYQADGGYLGSTISQGFSTSISKKFRVFWGLSYSQYSGSANEQSPLFRQNYNFSGAIGILWWFYESDNIENKNIARMSL